MVRMDSFSSVPPHIQPPMAQVPSAIRELTMFVPWISMYSSMVVLFLVWSEILIFLAKPLWIGDGAVEPMTGFIKLELTCFRSLCCFCQKRRNLGRIHRFKAAGSLESLLQNRERIAARNNNARGKIHRVVKALHRGGRLALENNVVTHGLHTQNASIVLEQDGQNLLFETIEVRVHYVEGHLNGIERKTVL